MYAALNMQNQKILINNAIKGEEYICPTCKKKLFVKLGSNGKKPHFCHYSNQSCIDYWKYDESEWSNEWKNSFKVEDVETVYDDHHIDVSVKRNLGIMFSSESVRRNAFTEKTDYIISNVKNAMWLFNLTELFKNREIKPSQYCIEWKKMWGAFSEYYYGKNVWIVVEIDAKEGSRFAVLKNVGNSYKNKKFEVLRWLQKDSFIKYFNDIADGVDPDWPYKEKERREKEQRAKLEEPAKNIGKDTWEDMYASLLAKQKQNKQITIDFEHQQILKQKEKESRWDSVYANDPEMRRMSDRLKILKNSNNDSVFAEEAHKWYEKYGFAWIRSKFNN